MELVALLFAVGLVARYWYLIAAVVTMFCAAHWSRLAVDRHFARVDAERRRVAGLVARADQQHNWTLQCDPRGTFGESDAT